MLAMVVGENRGIECRTRFLKGFAILREKELKTQVFEGCPEKELARGNWNDLGTKGKGRLSVVTAVDMEAGLMLVMVGLPVAGECTDPVDSDDCIRINFGVDGAVVGGVSYIVIAILSLAFTFGVFCSSGSTTTSLSDGPLSSVGNVGTRSSMPVPKACSIWLSCGIM